LPFFHQSLLGNVFYVTVLFGSYAVVEKKVFLTVKNS